ncbi:lipoprotein [Spiroplasma sp. ald]|uniref:lipoprotein n=1 Tax=Spiroplasma sp. ald TaxID=2490849 RepID=UPI0037DD71B9
MKKILSLLSTITLIGTSTTSLIACNNKPKIHEYTKEQLTKLKEENNINTKDGILEWIVPQEKPFNQVDNKWYFAIWKPNNSIYWKISKFKHDTNNGKKIDGWDPLKPYYIDLFLWVFETKEQDLLIDDQSESKLERIFWNQDKGQNFKAVYRWNLEDTNLPNLIIDKNGNIKVNT